MKMLLVLAITGCGLDEPATKTTPSAETAPTAARSTSRPVPGTRSLVALTTADASHCGGIATVIRHTGAADDLAPELVAALTIESPRGLDFASDSAGSRARFDAWIADATHKAELASELFTKQLADASAEQRVIGLARHVQILRAFADSLVHAEIPSDVRAGEQALDKTNAYCAALAAAAEPLQLKAEKAAIVCRAKSPGDGWWMAACAARTP